MSAGWAFAFNRIYCFFVMCLSGVAAAFFGFAFTKVDPAMLAEIDKGMEIVPFVSSAPFAILAGLFGVIAILNLVLLFSPKTPFWWWVNFVHLLLGVVSGGCAPFAILAMVGWVGEPLKREYYGRGRKKRGR